MALSNDGFLSALSELYSVTAKSGTVWLTSKQGAGAAARSRRQRRPPRICCPRPLFPRSTPSARPPADPPARPATSSTRPPRVLYRASIGKARRPSIATYILAEDVPRFMASLATLVRACTPALTKKEKEKGKKKGKGGAGAGAEAAAAAAPPAGSGSGR